MFQRANPNIYTNIRNETSVESADAHRLIELLYDGALERIAQAKGAQSQGRIDIRGAKISHAVNIVMGLRDSLEPAHSKEITDNLDALYDYIQRLLISAHKESSVSKLDEAADLLTQLSATWKEISPTH